MSTHGGQEPASRSVRNDPPASGTQAGADATARMSGTHTGDPYPEHDGRHDGNHDPDLRTVQGSDRREERVEAVRPTDRPHAVLPAKTSAAATFALVFGLAALFCALTAILAPAAVLFGLIGIAVGIAGLKMTKRPGVTGRGVAIGGLVMAVIGLLLGAAVLAGAAVVVNDEQRLDQLEGWIQDMRANLPSTAELRSDLPN